MQVCCSPWLSGLSFYNSSRRHLRIWYQKAESRVLATDSNCWCFCVVLPPLFDHVRDVHQPLSAVYRASKGSCLKFPNRVILLAPVSRVKASF
jgi:hypothetical protein